MAAYYNEIDPYAAQWLRNLIAAGHIAPGDVDERSISDVKPDDLRSYTQCHFFAGIGVWSLALRRAGWDDDRPVWTGSCPCQPFSTAGAGEGFSDERHLWPHWYHLITQCEPDRIFGEQVASKDGLGWLDLVQTDLEGAGYANGAVDICAAGVGAPHIRQRLWFVAERLADLCSQGLEERIGNGRIQRETVGTCQGETAECGSDTSGLADSDYPGLQPGRKRSKAARHGSTVDAEGSVSRLANSERERIRTSRQRSIGSSTREMQNQSEERQRFRTQFVSVDDIESPAGTAGPTNGPWRDVDWLSCRDGKWRPVEPINVKMVDGPTPRVGYLCPRETKAQEVNCENMQILQNPINSKEIRRETGGSRIIQSQSVLQSELHGCLDGRPHESGQSEEPSSSKPEDGKNSVPSMSSISDKNEAVCPPQGPRYGEQRPVKFEDLVRLLSQSSSLSELYGDRRTSAALSALRTAIYEERAMRDASIPVAEVWASFSEEAKNRVRVGFDATQWKFVAPFPLAIGARERVGRLKAYGNAINLEVAKTFIEAYLECN